MPEETSSGCSRDLINIAQPPEKQKRYDLMENIDRGDQIALNTELKAANDLWSVNCIPNPQNTH